MPHRLRSPFTHTRIGRRGACLMIFGFIPFSIGGALFVSPRAEGGRPRTIPVLAQAAPAEFWSIVWTILGLAVMACAFGTHRADRFGYVMAYSLPLFWSSAYVVSWLQGDLVTGWISALVYLGYCLLVVVIAGWDEPIPIELLTEIPSQDQGEPYE